MISDDIAAQLLSALAQKPADSTSAQTKNLLLAKVGNIHQIGRSIQVIHVPEQSPKLRAVVTPVLDYEEFRVAPVMVIDDLYQSTLVEKALAQIAKNEAQYREAGVRIKGEHLVQKKSRDSAVNRQPHLLFDYLDNWISTNLELLNNNLGVNLPNTQRREIKASYFGNGQYFRAHTDNTHFLDEHWRCLSWIYYLHKQPRQFTGGDLFVYGTKASEKKFNTNVALKIEPLCNRLVLFPSYLYHEVTTVKCDEEAEFISGRHSIAGHIHFPKTTLSTTP